jgi:hypothetical protein
MSLVVVLTVTFKVTISLFLKIIKHLCDICSEFLLWWSFSNCLAFRKRLSITPERVTQGKESSMTIKESDFLTVLQPVCIRVIHTYRAIQSTVDTPAGKFAISQIIMD